GSGVNGHNMKLAVTGGTLNVGTSGGTLVVSEVTNTANSATAMATLDLTGLNNFTANYGATGKIGIGTSDTVTTANGPNGTLILADQTNALTAGTMYVGYGSTNAGTNTLRLGTTNTINVDNIIVAGGKGPASLNFRAGLTNPSVAIRGSDGTSRVT